MLKQIHIVFVVLKKFGQCVLLDKNSTFKKKKKMEFVFESLVDYVPNLRVPSKFAQTLLTKAAFENLVSPAHIACVALASKSFQNSSMGANAASAFKITRQTVDLFNNVFHPASCFSIQLTPELSIDQTSKLDDQVKSQTRAADNMTFIGFVTALRQTKYFEKSLQKLDLDCCSEEIIMALIGPVNERERDGNKKPTSCHFSQLKSLWLWRPILSDETFASLFASTALSNLTELNFTSPTQAEQFADGVCNLHNLKKLSWGNDNDEAKDHLVEKILSDLPKLESLHLNGCDGITCTGVADMIGRGKFSRLTELSFSSDQVDDAVAADIAAHLGELTMLQLCACQSLTDDGVKLIASSLSNLTHLNLQYCGKITEKCLQHIAGGLKGLRVLELYGLDDGVNAVDKVTEALPKCRVNL